MIDARDRLTDERGFTLIELLVTMLIGMIVLFAAFSLTEIGGRATARTTDKVDVAQRSRTAQQQMVQQLRSQVCLPTPSVPAEHQVVPPIVAGSDNSVTFYADLDDSPYYRPQKRQIRLDPSGANGAGSIVSELYANTTPATQTVAPWSFAGSTSQPRTLLTDVRPIPGKPFLRYYGFDSAAPLGPLAPLDSNPSVSLPPNSVAKVVRIDVAFEARPIKANPVTGDPARRAALETSIYLRNTDFADRTTRGWGPRCD